MNIIKPRMRSIAQFTINYLSFIDDHHNITQPLPGFADQQTLTHLYRLMVLVRTVDKKAIYLQRTGKLGTYPSSCGQEAVSVGTGYALHTDDIYCPAYRDQGILLQRQVSISNIFAYWGGDERGNDIPQDSHDLPTCITVSGQCLHAAGVAFAAQHRNQNTAVVTMIGDGGTSKGDFYEALNVAGAWKLPLVIIINNNQWAISMPRQQQTAALTLAQKALAAGIECLQVDGNDIIAVTYAVKEAIQKARSGQGSSIIEAVTYRLDDHTTADDAKRYRTAEELTQAWKADPIERLQFYLKKQGWWDDTKEQQLQTECSAQAENAAEEYLSKPKASATDIFDFLYEKLPDSLMDQREELLEIINQQTTASSPESKKL